MNTLNPLARITGTSYVNLVALTKTLMFIVEKHSDGYVAYPLGLKGVVVGQGDSYEEALADAKAASRAHLETFGADALDGDSDVQAAYVAEAIVS